MTATSHSEYWKATRRPSTGARYRRLLAATLRLVGRAVRGLFAFAVLLALTAGLPWALVHFIGWPLPDHLPTWDEIQSTLLAPMSPQFLLNVLACMLWPLWARFTFDVLTAIPDVARATPWRRSLRGFRRGPLHTAAGVLVGAIVVSILSSRTPAPTTTTQAAASEFSTGGPTTAATALYHPETASGAETADKRAIVTAAVHTRAATPPPQDTETVKSPEHGVHDSLWRVAQRCLGDGNRWPEIWKLNQGATQTDGKVFTSPNLIRPGWQLRLPTPALTSPKPPPPVVEHPAPNTPPQPSDPGAQPDTRAPSNPQQSVHPTPADSIPPTPAASPGTGISLSTGAFVGLGLAALITVAMISVRLGRRRRYQPSSVETDDPGKAPVVRALRIAHDAVTLPHDDENAPAVPQRPSGSARPADLDTRDRAQATARAVLPTPETTVLGIRDGRAVALDLARSRGLGLIGPGAHAATRALIVALLAQAAKDGQGALVVIPTADAEALLGVDLPHRTPARLRVVDDLPAALALLEGELLARVRHDDETDQEFEPHAQHTAGPVVLVASPTADAERRMQAILDNGASVGLAGVLLGQWRPGGTARVRDDGTIGATSPTLTDTLAGARLFTLPGTDTTDLLTLLQAADPTDPEQPAPMTTNDVAGSAYEFITAKTGEPAPESPPSPELPPTQVLIDISSQDRTTEPDVAKSPADHDRPTPHSPSLAYPAETPNDDNLATSDSDRQPTFDRPTPRPPVTASDQFSDPENAPLHLQVLGRLHLTRTEPQPADLIEALAPRQREILVYLALHPDGSRRETLTAALWPDAPGDRPYNSFHATLSQLRRGLRRATGNEIANITVNEDGHYALDPAVVTVDLWQVHNALAARRHAATQTETVAALRRVADLYRGDLADSIAADWIDGPREALRRDVLDALSALIRTIGDEQPEQMLALLEQARSLDPYNEAIYRDLMRTQARLGQYDSIPRTLGLLTNSLATLDQRPTRDTLGLADFLRRPRSSHLRGREAS